MSTAKQIVEALRKGREGGYMLQRSGSVPNPPKDGTRVGRPTIRSNHVDPTAKPESPPPTKKKSRKTRPTLVLTLALCKEVATKVIRRFRSRYVAHPMEVAEAVLGVTGVNHDLLSHIVATIWSTMGSGDQQKVVHVQRSALVRVAEEAFDALLKIARSWMERALEAADEGRGPPSGFRRAPRRAPQLLSFETEDGGRYIAVVLKGVLHEIAPRVRHGGSRTCCGKVFCTSRRALLQALTVRELDAEIAAA